MKKKTSKVKSNPLIKANRKEFERALLNVIINARNHQYLNDLTSPKVIRATANSLLEIAHKGIPNWYIHHGHVPCKKDFDKFGVMIYNDLLFYGEKFIPISALEEKLPIIDNHPE